MGLLLRFLTLCCSMHLAHFTDSGGRGGGCVIELECEECLPDNMPLVTSHRAVNGSVRVGEGDELTLACGGGSLLAYPMRRTLAAVCERGMFRVRVDSKLRPITQLGCQESVFEDVLHPVQHCGPPLQARVYRQQSRHLAALCYDSDRALPLRLTACSSADNALTLPPHAENSAPLSLLGNFNHMFDARIRHDSERLYGDSARLQRRLHELLRPHRVALADHTLTAAPLLAPHYYRDQSMRVTEFASNKVLAWRSVAEGNLRNAQHDVARLLHGAPLTVHAGTHSEWTTRSQPPLPLYLKHGRFPVPRYIWTVVVDSNSRRALAIVVLNDPLVAVSEIRESVFCESGCQRAAWARQLTSQRRYETPAMGLTFCCDVHSFARNVTEFPQEFVRDIPHGDMGMLLDDYNTSVNEV